MKRHLILPLIATVLTLGYAKKSKGQEAADPGDRKVRIEITTNENGSTQHVTREFDLSDGEALEDALRDLGVFDEIGVLNDGENLVIDLKRLNDDGSALREMSMAMAMEDVMSGDKGGYLGVYGGNWNKSTCADDEKKNRNNKAVEEGACITHVIEGTPAEKAGLKEGDVITRIDDRDIDGFGDLAEEIGSHEPGDKVSITYWRDGKKNEASIELGKDEDVGPASFTFTSPDVDWDAMAYAWASKPGPFLGVDGEDAENNGGARITEVIEGTSAEDMGVQEGDVITGINGARVMSFATLAELIGTHQPGADVTLEIQRNGSPITLSGQLGEQPGMKWAIPVPPEAPLPPDAPDADVYYFAPHAEAREEMRREMDQLRREMDQLRKELRGEVRREMKVVIATIELDGKETDVLKQKGVSGLDNAPNLDQLQCFPNPSSGNFQLSFTAPERGDLNVDVHDAVGERVYHETITGFKGRYERLLDLSDLADGSYFLVIGQNGRTLARKLVKE